MPEHGGYATKKQLMLPGDGMILELLADEARYYNDDIRATFTAAHSINIFMYRHQLTLIIDQVDDELVLNYMDCMANKGLLHYWAPISHEQQFERFLDVFSLGLCMLVHHIKWEDRDVIDQLRYDRVQLFE